MNPDPVLLVNGVWRDSLPARDRGCMYGDGVFRTLRLEAGRPRWWVDQYATLAEDARCLGLVCPPSPVWEEDIRQLAGYRPEGAVKLVLTRGPGGRGYLPSEPVQATRLVQWSPLPDHYPEWRRTGMVLRVCDLRLGQQPRLAGVKHLNRLENVLARMEWDTPDIHEGLLLDADGRLVSGVAANVFLVTGDRLLTPPLDRCGVAGVTRRRVLRVAGELGLTIREEPLTLADALAADELLLGNSLLSLAWASRLEHRAWTPGPWHARLLDAIENETSDD